MAIGGDWQRDYWFTPHRALRYWASDRKSCVVNLDSYDVNADEYSVAPTISTSILFVQRDPAGKH
jgi:hypothetical protein